MIGKRVSLFDKVALILTAIGVLGFVGAGVFGQEQASKAVGVVVALLWAAWITWKSLRGMAAPPEPDNVRQTIVASGPSLPGNEPALQELRNEVLLIDHQTKKIRLPADFLDWPSFSLVLWVKVTEKFYDADNNRYLFAYTSNASSQSGHPNSFFAGIETGGLQWRLIIKGENPKNETAIRFASGHNLLGWKLFSIRWNRARNVLDFSVDAGRTVHEARTISEAGWPKKCPNEHVHIGSWLDVWHGGMAHLRFFDVRVFREFLADEDLVTIFETQRALLEKA